MNSLQVICGIALLSQFGLAAEVFELSKEHFGDRPGGKEADSIQGDFVLRSRRVEAVVSGDLPLRRANMGAFYGDGNHSPGCLYDLTRAGQNNDQLTVFSPCAQKGEVTHVRLLKEANPATAAVQTYISAETSGTKVSVTHEYRVHDDWEGILISTTFQNHSPEPVTHNIYDHWTQMRVVGEIKGIRWADSIDPADKCGYATAWVSEGDTADADARIVKRANRLQEITLAGGETLKIARFLAVGNSPAEAVGLVAKMKGITGLTTLSWQLKGSDNSSMANAKFVFMANGQEGATAYPDQNGKIEFPWFAEKQQVKIQDIGRDSVVEEIAPEADQSFSKTTELSALRDC